MERGEWPHLVLLVILCVLTIIAWLTAPPVVALRWNITGSVSAYGSKNELLLLPALGLILYVALRTAYTRVLAIQPGAPLATAYWILRLMTIGLLVLGAGWLILGNYS